MIITLLITATLIIAVMAFLYSPFFGRRPTGKQLERIMQSPHYRDGEFQNLENTPQLAEGVTYYTVFRDFFFRKSKRDKPAQPLPSKKENLLNLRPDENIVVWFGHSSYFMQVDGKTLLADPVFSGHASPVNFTTKAFAGSDVYTPDDFPSIDFLFLSHDHWDHLDYETVLKLKPKVKTVITGLGTGAHLERWGFNRANIIEKDWGESADLGDGFTVNVKPARHFSGRGLKRNTSLWVSFVLQTPTMKLFLGGDSGYGRHFKAIGEKFGPFDVAILECGQYNEYWKYIHMMPEEVVTAAQELRARQLLPVHWAKFSLGLHAWDEPIQRVAVEAEKQHMPLLTPMIGEKVNLDDPAIPFKKWWEGLE